MITELFPDIDTFRSHAEGVDGSLDLSMVSASYVTCKNAISSLIGAATYEALLATTGLPLDILRSAVANHIMNTHLIFLATSRNNGDQRLYKYQYEEMKDRYINAYWDAMDMVLKYLEDNPTIGDYADRPIHRDRAQLLVKDAAEFDYYYGINGSAYFYAKAMFLIRKVYLSSILPRVKPVMQALTDEMKELMKRALCYEVMAEAVRKFDLTELPRSIRFDLTHEFTKEGSQMQSREKLSADLMKDVSSWLKELEDLVSMAASQSVADVVGNYNEEQEKFYATL